MIDNLLERASRAPVFFLEQLGDIVVKSKRGSHIMMLHNVHHDVNTYLAH